MQFHSLRVSRRNACRQLLTAVGACLLPGITRADAGAGPFRLRYILASSLYGTLPLAEILSEVKKTGADAIDIWPKVHADQREQVEAMGHDRFRELLDQHGVSLGMTTRYDLGLFGLKDEFRFLKQFNGRLVIAGAKKGEGKTLRDKVQWLVRQLEPHVAVAEENGITIGVENHANSIIDSPDSLLYLAEFARSPNLGIALAPYHLPQNEQTIAGLISEMGPKLVHFYAWEHGQGSMQKMPKEQELQQLPGYGKLDFAPLLQALQKINYTGWTEIFMHPFPRGIPILDTASAVTGAVNRSRQYIEGLLKA